MMVYVKDFEKVKTYFPSIIQSKVSSPTSNNIESKPSVGVRRPTPVPSNYINSRPSYVIDQEPAKSRIDPAKSRIDPAKSRIDPAKSRIDPAKSRIESKTTPVKTTVWPTASRTSIVAASTRNDLVACDNCGRNIAPDRVETHKNICLKTSKKKRKPFDATKQRLKGTGAESYLKKEKTSVAPPQVISKKNNWRKKHEEFINNIRAAKIAQAHIAAGGKISDLPPPPPSDTSDYVQCPHCGRKFNEGAASCHIPKCANMLHNKPKPQQNQNRMQAARKRY